jgi:hypothetical protein
MGAVCCVLHTEGLLTAAAVMPLHGGFPVPQTELLLAPAAQRHTSWTATQQAHAYV